MKNQQDTNVANIVRAIILAALLCIFCVPIITFGQAAVLFATKVATATLVAVQNWDPSKWITMPQPVNLVPAAQPVAVVPAQPAPAAPAAQPVAVTCTATEGSPNGFPPGHAPITVKGPATIEAWEGKTEWMAIVLHAQEVVLRKPGQFFSYQNACPLSTIEDNLNKHAADYRAQNPNVNLLVGQAPPSGW